MTVTWRRFKGSSFFALNGVGVRFEGENCEVGVPNLEPLGWCRLADRGEAKIDGVGEVICIARTDDGVRKGGLCLLLLGVYMLESSGV